MRQRGPFAILIVLTVGSLSISGYLFLENRSLRARIAARGEAAIAPPPAESAAPTSQPAEATPAATDSPSAEAARQVEVPVQAGLPARGRGQGRWDRGGEMMARVLTDPEAREALVSRMKSQIDRVYGGLFVKLGLDEMQAETLRTLLAEQQLVRMETLFLERNATNDQEREEARARRSARTEAIESGITAVLGANGLDVLADYQRSQPQRQAVDDVARRSSYAGAPLSPQASDRLVQVLGTVQQEIPAPNPGANRWPRGGEAQPLTQQAADDYIAALQRQNQSIIAQAKSFLTTPQLEALADRQVEQLEQAKAQVNFQLRNPDMAAGGMMMDGFPGGFGGGRGGPRDGPPPGG